ncbi:hypothetical protein B0H11DRAFT_1924242 [Mycena galericulata]|nr:hypothetical protein B0H11DRAFT_1924242 [Mycena galericulata]
MARSAWHSSCPNRCRVDTVAPARGESNPPTVTENEVRGPESIAEESEIQNLSRTKKFPVQYSAFWRRDIANSEDRLGKMLLSGWDLSPYRHRDERILDKSDRFILGVVDQAGASYGAAAVQRRPPPVPASPSGTCRASVAQHLKSKVELGIPSGFARVDVDPFKTGDLALRSRRGPVDEFDRGTDILLQITPNQSVVCGSAAAGVATLSWALATRVPKISGLIGVLYQSRYVIVRTPKVELLNLKYWQAVDRTPESIIHVSAPSEIVLPGPNLAWNLASERHVEIRQTRRKADHHRSYGGEWEWLDQSLKIVVALKVQVPSLRKSVLFISMGGIIPAITSPSDLPTEAG